MDGESRESLNGLLRRQGGREVNGVEGQGADSVAAEIAGGGDHGALGVAVGVAPGVVNVNGHVAARAAAGVVGERGAARREPFAFRGGP